MKHTPAQIEREYGPFAGAPPVHGVAVVGDEVWFACGDRLQAFDPASGAETRALTVASDAGTTFDGRHMFQLAGDRILRIDPSSGTVVGSIPAPGGGRDSGMAWAEGSLWVGQHRDRTIHRIDPETGAILRTISSDRFVTGVTWSDGELWHGTWENDESELRHVDPETGAVLEALTLPEGVTVSGLDAHPDGRLFCGGGSSGKIRAVRKPARR